MKRISVWIGMAVLAATLLVVSLGAADMNAARAAERREAQRRAVERAAVLCFALEGAYPPELSYLEAHYGLIVDYDAYTIHYVAIGANVRPEIEVYPYE